FGLRDALWHSGDREVGPPQATGVRERPEPRIREAGDATRIRVYAPFTVRSAPFRRVSRCRRFAMAHVAVAPRSVPPRLAPPPRRRWLRTPRARCPGRGSRMGAGECLGKGGDDQGTGPPRRATRATWRPD